MNRETFDALVEREDGKHLLHTSHTLVTRSADPVSCRLGCAEGNLELTGQSIWWPASEERVGAWDARLLIS